MGRLLKNKDLVPEVNGRPITLFLKKPVKENLSTPTLSTDDILYKFSRKRLGNEGDEKKMRESDKQDLKKYSKNDLIDMIIQFSTKANMDALTGVANRRQFKRHIADCNKNLNWKLLMAIDISGFSGVNNLLGHVI